LISTVAPGFEVSIDAGQALFLKGAIAMPGILVGTLILWGLNSILVQPITQLLLARRMAAEGLQPAGFGSLPVADQEQWKGIATGYFIAVDVIVLAIAGLVGGLLGFWFIGFTTQLKGWPGMLAFIVCSFIGLGIAGTK